LKIRDSLRPDNSLFQYDSHVSVSVVLRKLAIRSGIGQVHHEAKGDRHGQFRDSIPASAEGMEYWIISTVDDKGNKATTGGMMKRQSPQQQGITNYFDVKSVQDYSAKVEKLGGKVIFPKHSVPGMGYIAICADTENNGFGIFEADQTAK
jgi:uncharacterized protein